MENVHLSSIKNFEGCRETKISLKIKDHQSIETGVEITQMNLKIRDENTISKYADNKMTD